MSYIIGVILFSIGLIYYLIKKNVSFDPLVCVPLVLVTIMFFISTIFISTTNQKSTTLLVDYSLTLTVTVVFISTFMIIGPSIWRLVVGTKTEKSEKNSAQDTLSFLKQVNVLSDPASLFTKMFTTKPTQTLESEATAAKDTLDFFKTVGLHSDPAHKTAAPALNYKSILLCVGYLFSFIIYILSFTSTINNSQTTSSLTTSRIFLFVLSILLFLCTMVSQLFPNFSSNIGLSILYFLVLIVIFFYFFSRWFARNDKYFIAAFFILGCMAIFAIYVMATYSDTVEYWKKVVTNLTKPSSPPKKPWKEYLLEKIFSAQAVLVFLFLLILFLFILLFNGSYVFYKPDTSDTTKDFLNCLWQMIVIGIIWMIVSRFFKKEHKSILYEGIYNAKFVIFYVILLIVVFNFVPSDTLNAYAYLFTPLLMLLGASIFYSSLEKDKPKPTSSTSSTSSSIWSSIWSWIWKPRKQMSKLYNKVQNNPYLNDNSRRRKRYFKYQGGATGDELKKLFYMQNNPRRYPPYYYDNQYYKNALLKDLKHRERRNRHPLSKEELIAADERMKTVVVYFCLLVSTIIFYVYDPGNYFSTYLGPNFAYTIVLGVFAFLYLTVLVTYPITKTIKKEEVKIVEVKDIFGRVTYAPKIEKTEKKQYVKSPFANTKNATKNFDGGLVASTIGFVLFLVIVTITILTYKGGFLNDKGTAAISIIIIIMIVIIWGSLLLQSLFEKIGTADTKLSKSSLFRNILLIIFGLVFLAVLIAFLVAFISDASSSATTILRFIFNLLFLIFYGWLFMKTILPETKLPYVSKMKMGKISLVIFAVVVLCALASKIWSSLLPLKMFFIVCVGTVVGLYFGVVSIASLVGCVVAAVATAFYFGFLNEMGKLTWYQQAGVYGAIFLVIFLAAHHLAGTEVRTQLIFIFVSVALMLLYFYYPTVQEKISLNQTGKQLLLAPVSLNTQTTVSNYEDLNGSDSPVYNFAISCWIYIDADPPNSRPSSTQYTSVLNYGGKPNVLYNVNDTSIMITMLASSGGAEPPEENDFHGNTILYQSGDACHLQKWNHLLLNYDGGTMDIFVNGQLVRSTAAVVPFLTLDALTVGEDEGINGDICNLVYFTEAQPIANILYLYNTMRTKTPPVPATNNQIIDTPDIVAGAEKTMQ